jgi:acetyl esterase/lipase
VEEEVRMMMRSLAFAAAILLAGSAVALAQVPPEIAAQTRAAGQTMDPASGTPYAALFPPEAWEGVTVERDVAYGPDPLHKLDIYTAPGGERRPVLLFVHGGGFLRGDKHGAFYPDNIPLWAAKQGMVGVTINYRLAPNHSWPAGAQDLAAAVAWTQDNIARHGGDPERIVLFGHSAGANHVADYVGDRSVQGREAAAVKGAVLLSPNYPENPGDEPHAYYGTDWELNSTSGTVTRLRASDVPIFLADAEFDPDPMLATARALREGLCDAPARCPRSVHLKDHNHFTEGMALGTEDQSLAAPLLDWMAGLFGERG